MLVTIWQYSNMCHLLGNREDATSSSSFNPILKKSKEWQQYSIESTKTSKTKNGINVAMMMDVMNEMLGLEKTLGREIGCSCYNLIKKTLE